MSSFLVLRGCPSHWYDLGTTQDQPDSDVASPDEVGEERDSGAERRRERLSHTCHDSSIDDYVIIDHKEDSESSKYSKPKPGEGSKELKHKPGENAFSKLGPHW